MHLQVTEWSYFSTLDVQAHDFYLCFMLAAPDNSCAASILFLVARLEYALGALVIPSNVAVFLLFETEKCS
jgi:hypothetical protein